MLRCSDFLRAGERCYYPAKWTANGWAVCDSQRWKRRAASPLIRASDSGAGQLDQVALRVDIPLASALASARRGSSSGLRHLRPLDHGSGQAGGLRVPQGHAQGPVRQLSQRHDVLSLDAEHRDASCVAQTFFKRTHEPGVLASATCARSGCGLINVVGTCDQTGLVRCTRSKWLGSVMSGVSAYRSNRIRADVPV